jgi:CheY-like chemotaxis protein
MGAARILIAERDRNARSALAELLRDEGFSIAAAANEPEALAKLGEIRPDVLLTDDDMPALLNVAQRFAPARAPALIVMTAFDDEWHAAAAVLRKPIALPRLLAALAHALAPAEGSPPRPAPESSGADAFRH